MNLLQQTFQPVAESEQKQWLDTRFRSDDDSSLQVSVYLGSNEGRTEVLVDVTQVLRAYGFTNFARMEQAPGSRFFSIEVRFGKDDRQAAQKSKKQLLNDLLNDIPPGRPPQKRRAVRKLKKSLWSRAGKKLVTIILAGTTAVGGLAVDIFRDEIKGGIEDWLKDNRPKIVQKVDSVVAKELPAGVADSFHRAVKDYIDRSPDKTKLKPPPSK
jgi:hypothetical protein